MNDDDSGTRGYAVGSLVAFDSRSDLYRTMNDNIAATALADG